MKALYTFLGAFVLIVALIISMALPVYAAETTVDGKIKISDTLDNVTGTSTVTATATGSSKYGEQTNTITVTNVSDSAANVSFTWSATRSYKYGGSISCIVNGKDSTTGTFNEIMEADASITITLYAKGGWGSAQTATLTLSNFTYKVVESTYSVTVSHTTGGSVTVDGEAATSGTSYDVSPTTGVALAATADSGATFLGWTDGSGNILSNSPAFTLKPAEIMTVKALFLKDGGQAMFGVGPISTEGKVHVLALKTVYTDYVRSYSRYFDDLHAAAAYAQNSSTDKCIVLLNSGTLSAGNYSIPSGVTLLLPFDSNNLLRRVPTQYVAFAPLSGAFMESDPPDSSIVSYGDVTNNRVSNDLHRTLTMAANTHITVNGDLEVSGQTHPMGVGTFGQHSVIQMTKDSSITINETGTLFSYGYIRGDGTVTVHSGGKVYQNLDLLDYTGGAGVLKEITDRGAFSITDFTFNNVEVKMDINEGATMNVFLCIYGNLIGYNTFVRAFVGPVSTEENAACFQIAEGKCTTSFANGELTVEVDGETTINRFSITLEAAGVTGTVDSAATSGLPLGKDWNAVVKEGAALTCNENMMLLAGGTVTVEKNATLTAANGKNFYILSAEGDPSSVETDAVLDINGTLVISGGTFTKGDETFSCGLYTSSNGKAKIISSQGTGQAILNSLGNAPSITLRDVDTHTDPDNPVYVNEFDISPAKLLNSDNSIVETANGGVNTYTYTEGNWRCATHTWDEGTVTTAATCTEAGVKTFTCAVCSGTKTEEIPSSGHTEVVDTAVPPTCTETGLTEGKHCSVCNEVLVAQEEVAALGHSYTSAVTDPTCTDEGFTTYTCSVCGDSYTDDKEPATGIHTDADTDNLCDSCGTYLCVLKSIEACYDAEVILCYGIRIPDKLLNTDTAYVRLTKVDGLTDAECITTYSMAELEEAGVDEFGNYIVSTGVASGEMYRKVKVQIFEDDNTPLILYTADYSAYESDPAYNVMHYGAMTYAYGDDDQKTMVDALLTYGAYAQAKFGVDTEHPADSLLDAHQRTKPNLDAVTKDTLTQTSQYDQNEIGIKIKSTEPNLDSRVYLRLAFATDANIDFANYTFELTYRDGNEKKTRTMTTEEVIYDAEKNVCYAMVYDIPAAYLDNMYTVTITNKTTNQRHSVSTSVICWARQVLIYSSDEATQNLAKALYLYNEAAKTFFKIQEIS